MSLYLPEQDALFIHIPRTGGDWLRRHMRKSGARTQLAHKHFGRNRANRKHAPPHYYCRDFGFTFSIVRRPEDWYLSMWKWLTRWRSIYPKKKRVTPEYHPKNLLLPHFAKNPDKFVSNVINFEKCFYTRMVEWYLGPADSYMTDLVLRTESLSDSLPGLLAHLEINCPEIEEGNRNDTHIEGELDEHTKALIRSVEAPMIRRFYE